MKTQYEFKYTCGHKGCVPNCEEFKEHEAALERMKKMQQWKCVECDLAYTVSVSSES